MATATSLNCGICHERYDRPKILQCQHSFCLKCLEEYCRSTVDGDATAMPCPVCRRETRLPKTGVRGLVTNLYVVGLVERIKLQEMLACPSTTLSCETCVEENDAVDRCLDCEQNICSNCCKIHQRIAATSKHTIISLSDIRDETVTEKEKLRTHHPKCTVHEGEVTRFFCKTCGQLICRDCTVVDHCKPQHEYVDVNQVTATSKQSLAELFHQLEQILKELAESRETLPSKKRKLSIAVDESVAKVQDRAAELRDEVTAQEKCLVEDIKNLQKDRAQQMDELVKTTSMTAGIEYSLETAKMVTRGASGSDFLSLYSTISEDLTFWASQDTPQIHNRLAHVRFQQSEGVMGINLGTLLKEVKWGLCREFSQHGHGSVNNSGCQRQVHCASGRDIAAYHIAAYHPDKIAVVDNTEVAIFSTKGAFLTSIPYQGHTYPCGIAAINAQNRLVVVAAEEPDVKVFNEDSTSAFVFTTAPSPIKSVQSRSLQQQQQQQQQQKQQQKHQYRQPSQPLQRSVAVKNDGTIIVGDVKRMVLTEHSPTDGTLIRTIPVKMKPCLLAVHGNGRVLISSGSNSVDVIDRSGDTCFTIKPTIGGTQVESCSGICSHSSDIYIAMHTSGSGFAMHSGHIHQYDSQGAFLGCIVSGLSRPGAITFTADGQLAVLNRGAVIMYNQNMY